MKRICPLHGLWNKTTEQTKCPKCKTANAKEYDKKYRNKEHDKFYHSAAWKRVRKLQLDKEPFCVECGKTANTVDHKKAIKDGGAKLDIGNLQSMCGSCHNIKEAKEGNRW